MNTLQFYQDELTGSSIVGAITPLGHNGPKHYGVIIGKCNQDGNVYVAESTTERYQLTTKDEFINRYKNNGEIRVFPNNGPFKDVEVAQCALDEVTQGGDGKYDLITNNCESFANRVTHKKTTSKQVVNTILGCMVAFLGVWVIKETLRT